MKQRLASLIATKATVEGEVSVSINERKRRRLRCGRPLVLVSLVAAATASAAGWFGTGSAGAARAHKLDTITIAITGPTATQDVPLLAAKKGYFAQYGLDVNVQILASSQALPAIASGQVQFIEGAEPQAMNVDWSSNSAATHNKPVRLLGYW